MGNHLHKYDQMREERKSNLIVGFRYEVPRINGLSVAVKWILVEPLPVSPLGGDLDLDVMVGPSAGEISAFAHARTTSALRTHLSAVNHLSAEMGHQRACSAGDPTRADFERR